MRETLRLIGGASQPPRELGSFCSIEYWGYPHGRIFALAA
jgi:hypothetical protein